MWSFPFWLQKSVWTWQGWSTLHAGTVQVQFWFYPCEWWHLVWSWLWGGLFWVGDVQCGWFWIACAGRAKLCRIFLTVYVGLRWFVLDNVISHNLLSKFQNPRRSISLFLQTYNFFSVSTTWHLSSHNCPRDTRLVSWRSFRRYVFVTLGEKCGRGRWAVAVVFIFVLLGLWLQGHPHRWYWWKRHRNFGRNNVASPRYLLS